jgi:hypothetical protein
MAVSVASVFAEASVCSDRKRVPNYFKTVARLLHEINSMAERRAVWPTLPL